MKPVNLLPKDAPVATVSTGKPNMGMIGGAAVVVVAVIGVAAYFAMARVDSIKSETVAAQAAAASATSETAAVQSQTQSIGQPVVDSDKQLAQGAEQVVVAAYTERYDFVQLAQELRGIMTGTGGWYEHVEASTSSSDGTTQSVTITGYMPTAELAASFNERVTATRTLDNATVSQLASETLTDLDSKRPARYWKFTIGADLVDTEAPFASTGASAGAGADASVIVVDSSGDEALTLSLDPRPKPKAAANKPKPKPKPAVPAKPKNPFGIAASAAAGGKS